MTDKSAGGIREDTATRFDAYRSGHSYSESIYKVDEQIKAYHNEIATDVAEFGGDLRTSYWGITLQGGCDWPSRLRHGGARRQRAVMAPGLAASRDGPDLDILLASHITP